MFSVNLTRANVGSGLWALARRGFSAVLVGLLTLVAFSAAAPLSAAPPSQHAVIGGGHSEQIAKFNGTLVSISRDGANIQLTLSGGITMTLPQNAVTVFDERTHTRTRSSVSQLAAAMHVIVKTHMDKSGKVTEAKIRIVS